MAGHGTNRGMLRPMHTKLGVIRDGVEEAWAHPEGSARETLAGGTERLRITCRGDYTERVQELVSALQPPFKVLYVLLMPRGGSQPGRYESPALEAGELAGLFRDFGDFWSEDSRHDIWVRSGPDRATVVWDRHGLIYAYGPLARFESVLAARGHTTLAPGEIPSPHVHYYHPQWDDAERTLLARLAWKYTPLTPADQDA